MIPSQEYKPLDHPGISLFYEPVHDKTNKMACAPSEDSDQLCAQWVVKDPSFLHTDNRLINLGRYPG